MQQRRHDCSANMQHLRPQIPLLQGAAGIADLQRHMMNLEMVYTKLEGTALKEEQARWLAEGTILAPML